MLQINAVAALSRIGKIALLTIDSPPVNALGAVVRQGIASGLEKALADTDIDGVVLICGGSTFFAGADIGEFGKPVVQPDLNGIIAAIDAAEKLIVAAIHGSALGGGFELALACHARIAARSARVGLPEVNLGLLPGAGGTQRLPRLLGAGPALDMMLTGKPVAAPAALEAGLIDDIADANMLQNEALAFARDWLARPRPLRRISDMDDKIRADRDNRDWLQTARSRHARLFRGFRAPANILQAVQAAVDLPFDKGMARERELFLDLLASKESAAQRYAFFAEREAARIPNMPADTKTLDIARVGVVGAGTMGGGIAMNFLDIGVPVTLVEREADALARGLALIRKNYEASARKGRISMQDVDARLALIEPTLHLGDLSDHDLVIEAVYENIDLKKDIFKALDSLVAPRTILASNTSFLDLDAIADATSHPERVIGLHFFSPANVMRLLEVVRGRKTSPWALATAMKLSRRIGKVAVCSGVCRGFIANRTMSRRSAQASALILQGPTPSDIDRVLQDFGFAMGPFAMMDLVGLDVVGWDRAKSSGSTVQEILCEAGRWGIKRGAGYYDYDDNRTPSRSLVVEDMIADFAHRQGIARRPIPDAEILERLLFPVINEGAKLLEEGVALRASDIDTALIAGYGWPVYTGGPMFWAGTIGLDRVFTSLKAMASLDGDAFRPCALIEELAATGKTFNDAGVSRAAQPDKKRV